MRATRGEHRKCCLCSVSVVVDPVDPASSLSVETFTVIVTGPCPATNDLNNVGVTFLIRNALGEIMT